MSPHPVPFEELVEVLRYQGLSEEDIRPGDIILIRSGYINQYESMSEDKRARLDALYKKQKPENIGVEPSEELLKFLWEKKISAVAGDTRSFEVWPCTQTQWHLHEWLLAGWGMPIGELFDLEKLSKACSEANRYTFFFTSAPMNVSDVQPKVITNEDRVSQKFRPLERFQAPQMLLHSFDVFSRTLTKSGQFEK
ncbi:hypothetical protein AbraIFM66950_010446 [Aspergillus brasiliensis]|nr:hypothetical protein AbraIFM66950_010446 [Aspergillus brasiliensis]